MRSEFDLFREIFGDDMKFGGFPGGGGFTAGGGGFPGAGGFGGGGGFPGAGFGTRSARQQKDQDQEIEYGLSLEDMYKGCSKKIKLTRKVLDASGEQMDVTKLHEFTLKPGIKPGTKIRFEGEGDEKPNLLPADVVLVIKEKPHPRFSREGNDLVLKEKISLSKALTGFEQIVETLDGRKFRLPVREIVSPGYRKTIHNEGFPIKGDVNNKGDLHIVYEIEFPTYLTSDKKTKIKELLDS